MITALSVQTQEASGVHRIELTPSVRLQAVVGPRLVGGWSYGPTWLAGGALDWHLAFPVGTDAFLVGASVAALSSPPFAGEALDEGVLRRLQIYPLLIEGGYQLHFHPRLVGRAGLGLGPVLGAATIDRAGHTLDRELALALLAEASVGLGVVLGRGVLETSLRGGFGLPLSGADGVGQLGGLWGGIGYRVPF
jgi:hypothetical protein